MDILSPPLTSTRGRAPVFSATMRFWISVDSLKRPPTLLTMASSFSSSSMGTLSLVLGELLPDDPPHRGDGLVQHLIQYLVLVLADTGQFAFRAFEAPRDHL